MSSVAVSVTLSQTWKRRRRYQQTTAMNRYPIWYIINDLLIVAFNLLTICTGMTFSVLVLREKKLRTMANLLSCHSCICGSLLAMIIIWDVFYVLRTDISGIARQDWSCSLRNTLMSIAMMTLNYSLCIQTYHRFISIVHCQRTSLRSLSLYIKTIVLQWLLAPLLMLPIILSGQIVYQTEIFVCQVSFSHTFLFIYFFLVSYGIPLVFILIFHLFIVHYMRKHWEFYQQRCVTNIYIIYPMQRIVLLMLILLLSHSAHGIYFVLERCRLSAVLYAQKIGLTLASLSFTLTIYFLVQTNRSVRKSHWLLFRHRQS